VRAVNLIPDDERRAGGGVPGRAGASVYVALGVLAFAVLAVAVTVLTNNTIKHRQAELAKVSLEATAAETETGALKPYADFAALKAKRVETVRSLAESRFDWEHVMRDLSRVMPKSAWLTSFTGTVAPGVQVPGGGGALRGALPVPAVELAGCADSQSEVARLMARLRLINGVTRVSLQASEKAERQAGATASGDASANSSDCRQGSDKFPQFSLVLFFEGKTAAPASPTAGTPASTTSTTPASTTPTTTPAATTPAATAPTSTAAAPAPAGGTP
jgi:Tfp pilus assembly protein PilN